MTAEITTVYRSTHPSVLAAAAQHAADLADWKDRAADLLTELGFTGRDFLIAEAMGDRWIDGIEYRPGDPIPPGWRLNTRKDGAQLLRPDRRGQPGIDIDARIRATKPPEPLAARLPGMPYEHQAGRKVYSPIPRVMGGAVWVAWPCPPDGVSHTYWEPARVSAYYAARESESPEAPDQEDHVA